MALNAQPACRVMRLLRCEQVIGAAENGRLLTICVQLFDRSQEALSLATLDTLLSRPLSS